MSLFNFKKKNHEFELIKSYYNKIESICELDKYISRKEYILYYEEILNLYNEMKVMEEKSILKEWCKKNSVDYKTLKKYLDYISKTEETINAHNEMFVYFHLESDKNYLDNILYKDDPNILLDEDQRRVVLSDEDYTLVIAGAGAGKTTTIEAKVKYLIDKNKIDPNRILIVSFTKKATSELKTRFNRLGINVKISTFHSIGNTIIKENEQERHKIVNNGFMYDTIKEYLQSKLDDEYFIRKILLFFASYLNMPFNDTNTASLFKSLREDKITTLKSDLEELVKDFHKEQVKKKITINNERVRSFDECRIANFLFINGINYIYEPVYRYTFKNSIKPYCPDFVIKQGNKLIYLEHFGISQNGTNSRYNNEELEIYKKHVNDKILLHREHGTNLIYTFSKYNDGKDLIEHLKEELLKANICLNTKSSIDIYKKIIKNAEDKYFNKFIMLICNFIGKFKTNNYKISKFDEWKITVKDERTKLFIDICYQCFLAYTNALKREKAIDFEDMINNAASILDKRISEKEELPYDYILVDEYQDISLQRFDLCDKLSQVSNAKIIAVGDDWQSIFKFSGARIDLFTRFKEVMKYANILKITKTYRNSQELIDIAGSFVMENDEQIKKTLKSNKSLVDPVIVMTYNDSIDKDKKDKGQLYHMGEAIIRALDHIVNNHGETKSVLLIGRYNFDGSLLLKLEDLFTSKNNSLVAKKYPNVKIHFLTAHSSKGLGYDNVIIINGKDAVLGFPSQIIDDPIMRLVIKEDEEMDFSEERRLFYVALTRTKNRVYLITPQYKPSSFILELINKHSNIISFGDPITPISENITKYKCPYCGYPLQKRTNQLNRKLEQKTLWLCSNDPEICGFMTNDLKGNKLSISKCPDCEDGYLIVKAIKDENGKDTGNRMLGCTNYQKDGKGCNRIIMQYNFAQSINEIERNSAKNSSMEKIELLGYEVKELIYLVINVIKNVKKANPNFDFSLLVLKDFLLGINGKVINSFKLYQLENFGVIDAKYQKSLEIFLKVLIIDGILKNSNDKYNNIYIDNQLINDDICKSVYYKVIKN